MTSVSSPTSDRNLKADAEVVGLTPLASPTPRALEAAAAFFKSDSNAGGGENPHDGEFVQRRSLFRSKGLLTSFDEVMLCGAISFQKQQQSLHRLSQGNQMVSASSRTVGTVDEGDSSAAAAGTTGVGIAFDTRGGKDDDVEDLREPTKFSVMAWFMEPKREYTKTERNMVLFFLSFATTVGIIGGTMYSPALHHIQQEFNASTSEVNLTLSIYLGMSALGPILFGFIGDIWGRKLLLFLSQLIGTIACFLLFTTNDMVSLTVYRALQGIYATLVGVAAAGIVADIYSPLERGEAMGWVTLGISLGPVLGPILGGVIAGTLKWQYIFLFNGIVAAINMFVGLFFIKESLITRSSLNIISMLQPLITCVKPMFLMYALPSSFVFAVYFYIVSILSAVLANSYGYGIITTGLMFMPMGFGMVIGSIGGGRIIDRFGAAQVALVILFGPVLILAFAFLLSKSLVGMLAVMFFLGIVVILSSNSLTVLLTVEYEGNKASALSAFRFVGFGMSFICVQLGGVLQDHGVTPKSTCIYYSIAAMVSALPLLLTMFARKWMKKGKHVEVEQEVDEEAGARFESLKE